MTDEELVADVIDELFWDPKVDSQAIAVGADGGVATVRGAVGSFREKRAVRKTAERVWGVLSATNELEVELMGGQRREDADLRDDVLQALTLDSLVPTTVDAWVDHGLVGLTGTVDWQDQRDEAEFIAGNVIGVLGLANDIDPDITTPSPDDVAKKIKKAFTRNAKLDADDLAVSTSEGTVTLTGTVGSWDERDAAVAAAWAAPGVKVVDDLLTVAY